MLFVNLAVADVRRSRAFFSALGLTFNEQYCSDDAICVMINDTTAAMLLHPHFFQGFTKRQLCPTATHTEALIAMMLPDRAAVDTMVANAVAHGGAHAMPAIDHGFMYAWSFYDPDGHHWEVFCQGEAPPA